jgi:thiol:disulfide interchange protein
MLGTFVLAHAALAQMQDPFSVTVETSVTEGDRSLSVGLMIPSNHYVYADQVVVKADAGDALVVRQSPTPKEQYDSFFDKVVGIYEQDIKFLYGVKAGTQLPLRISVSYQGCSKSPMLCFLPSTKTFVISADGVSEEKEPPVEENGSPAPATSGTWKELMKGFTVGGSMVGYSGPEKFIAFLDSAEAGSAAAGDSLASTLKDRGMWLVLVIILAGGLTLNLTPCVLPMIPINIAIIGAGAQAGSRGRGFALGGTYGLGIAFVYGALGLAVVLTGSTFGALNTSPWFNFSIAALFIVMSLAMFGILNIDFSRFQKSGTSGQRGGFVTAFILGAVAALLAGACVAPVVISVLLLSADIYSKGSVAGLLLPFLLGVGMALPWPFAGAGLSFLPKPGKWMEKVKYGFGVLILVFAIRYALLGSTLVRNRSASSRESVVAAQHALVEAGDWLTSLEPALVKARYTENPVFLDFWASSCKSCLKMEKTTFKNDDVRARLEPFVKVKYRAENMSDPDTKAVLDHLKVKGLPTYVVLLPKTKGKG